MVLADLIDDDRPDLFAGKARLLRLPCGGRLMLLLRHGMGKHLGGLCIGDGLHSVLERLWPGAVRLMFVDEIECGAKR